MHELHMLSHHRVVLVDRTFTSIACHHLVVTALALQKTLPFISTENKTITLYIDV